MTRIVDLFKDHSIGHPSGMSILSCIRTALLVCGLVLILPLPVAASGDGQHDFDFEIGVWKTHLKRLVHPLSGSNTWVELDGTTVVRKIWDGRANLAELETDAASATFECCRCVYITLNRGSGA
jgi:hypothetical protein